MQLWLESKPDWNIELPNLQTYLPDNPSTLLLVDIGYVLVAGLIMILALGNES